jgi:putative ABC transport system permease protein
VANIVGNVERLWQDLRHGARIFARNPTLTAIAIVSIAFGTGANVAIYSLADVLLLRPLPIPRPSELVSIGSKVRHGPFFRHAASYRDYLDIRDRARSFQGLVAFTYETVGLSTRADETPQVRLATFVSNNFFQALHVEPQLGRGFRPEEDGTAGPNTVVILSDSLWASEFGRDPSVLDRTVRVGGVALSVVGVAPASFTGLDTYVRDAVYLPITTLPRVKSMWLPDVLDARDARILTVKGRLQPDTTLSAARAELLTIGQDLERLYPASNRDQAIVAQTELEYKLEMRPLDGSLVVLLGTLSIAVLCVACANVAALLASRAPVRAREMALRLAVGASRARLVRQLVTEGLGIAIAGGAGGLLVGWAGIALLRQVQYPTELITHPQFTLNTHSLVVALVVAMASALLVGLGPALQTTRVDLTSSLKSDRSHGGRHKLTGRSLLVATQVALSLVVLTIAVFAVQAFRRELTAGPGFRTSHLAKITISPGRASYDDDGMARFFTRALDEARHLPGVRSASLTSAMPLFSFVFEPVLPEGRAEASGQDSVPAWANSIDDRYFETMAIPVLAGRTFTAADDAAAPAVAIVNETFARHYWPDDDPIGKRVQVLGASRPLVEIVGVVKTSTYGMPGEVRQDAIYFPYRQRMRSEMVLLTETSSESAALLQPLRDLVRRLDPDVPIADVQTIEMFYGVRIETTGTALVRLVAIMGLMGLVLTMVGLYGLVSYAVSRRTREIGIRIAIGATYSRILAMVIHQGMLPAWLGLGVGMLASVTAARLLARLGPFGHHVDARTYYLVVPLVIVIALLAAFFPARRAARVNPTTALRTE